MSGTRSSAITIEWYDGPRDEIRDLFELADDSPSQLDSYIELGRVLVAREPNGEIVGHLQLLPAAEPDLVEIKNLAVRARSRQQGVGRRLIEHAVSVCRDEQVRALTLITALADLDILRFYQRCGFRASSIEPDTFTPDKGYPPDLEVDGIPVRDAIRFVRVLSTGEAG
jgi:N-acetylglutamate synthase-like GNAT family acetyltransferase